MSQLSPSQALTVNEGIDLLPRHSDQTRYPGSSRHFDKLKPIQQHRPNVPTNPDRSCTYLVLRAHRMSKTSGWHRPWLPRGRRTSLGSDQHLDKHWPGGAKIKMTLERATPKGKVGGGEANGQTNVGPCWRSFIQSELSRGSHKSPDCVRNTKSGNITPV